MQTHSILGDVETKGKSFREGSGSGQASLENSYHPGGRKLEF